MSIILDVKKINHAQIKILGKFVAGSFSFERKNAATKPDKQITCISAVKHLEDPLICGDFNIWKWKNYFIHPVHFS